MGWALLQLKNLSPFARRSGVVTAYAFFDMLWFPGCCSLKPFAFCACRGAGGSRDIDFKFLWIESVLDELRLRYLQLRWNGNL